MVRAVSRTQVKKLGEEAIGEAFRQVATTGELQRNKIRFLKRVKGRESHLAKPQ